MPQTTFATLLSSLGRPNWGSVVTKPNLPFPLRFILDVGRPRKTECSRLAFLNKTHASVCDPASRHQPASFSFLYLLPFALSFLSHPSSFLGIRPLPTDTTYFKYFLYFIFKYGHISFWIKKWYF